MLGLTHPADHKGAARAFWPACEDFQPSKTGPSLRVSSKVERSLAITVTLLQDEQEGGWGLFVWFGFSAHCWKTCL